MMRVIYFLLIVLGLGLVSVLAVGCKKPETFKIREGTVSIRVNFSDDVASATVYGGSSIVGVQSISHGQILSLDAKNIGVPVSFAYTSVSGGEYRRVLRVQLHHTVVNIGPDGSFAIK